jgi:hypothetical protein
MKFVKRLLFILSIFLILLIGMAVAIPYIYQDEIFALVEEEINKNVNADVELGDIDLSLLKSFPNINLELKDFSVVGRDEFDGQQLASGQSAAFSLDLMSVVKADRPIAIRSVRLDQPSINILVTKEGKANYDIAITTDERIEETAAETDYSNVVINLDRYAIQDAYIKYEDKSADIFFEAKGLNHSGSGNFTIDIYDLDTSTKIEGMTVEQGGVAFLKNANAELEAVFNIDQPNSKYTLKDNVLQLNALKLNAEGFVQLEEENINMDLAFSTPQNDFKSLWSMIPNAYIKGYEEVKANGQFSFNGLVKGTYNGASETYPSFNIDLSVADANVQYPGLPLGVSNIAAQAKINSPGSDFDDLTVDVSTFKMKLGDNPFQASFFLKRPISDPDVKVDAKGIIDLGDISKAFPVEGVEVLRGILDADVKINTRLSTIENEDYEHVDMAGDLTLQDFTYQGTGLPKVDINSMAMNFTPQQVNVPDFEGKLGKSDIKASGSIKNILAYFSPEKTMKGQFQLRSNYFNADEWMVETSESNAAEVTSSNSYGSTTEEVEIFDRFDFSVDAAINQIVYDVYDIREAKAIGHMTPNRLEVEEIKAKIGDSDFDGKGVITGIFDYLFEDGTLGGDLDVYSTKLNLNQFMEGYEGETSTTATTTDTESFSTIPVPENIDMTITASVGQLNYTNIELKNVSGKMVIANEAVVIDKVVASGLGGQLGMSGSYDTKDVDNPAFNFKYDLQSLDFQDAFNTFNTFSQLAPIGKFIRGNFSSTLIMDGKLGQDMMPKIETLNAEGFLETINGVINNFNPTSALGEKLGVNFLKDNIKITNTRNWFEIVDGTLELKEYDARVEDIAMKIGGKYNLTSLMDFNIKAKIPRKTLENNAVGALASSGLNLLQGQASKLGLNLNQGEYVNVLINLKGAIDDPKVALKLLGLDGEGDNTSLTDSVKEEAKEEARKKIEEGKDAAKAAVEEAAEKARKEAEKKAREAAEKAKAEAEKKAREAAEKALGEVVDSAAQKKVDDVLDKVGKDAEDKIKDNLKKWNPFKNKGGG